MTTITTESDDHFWVDLKLDPSLTPEDLKGYPITLKEGTSQQMVNYLVRGKEKYSIGSCNEADQIVYPGDFGLFGCILLAWQSHWNLRTRPEDWWGSVASIIAKSIDVAAKNPRTAKKVREMFVSHEGKETIEVDLPSFTIYDSDYDDFFSQISSQIEDKIKVPKYAKAMQNDFGSSGPAHKISSQINLMASMKEFFVYEMDCYGCGLRGLQMAGSVEDWVSLVTKLKEVRKILDPIKNEIKLDNTWWDHVLDVFQNLANTRKNPNDPAVAKFWINILMDTTQTKYIGGGPSSASSYAKVSAYDGWLVMFLTGRKKILEEELHEQNEITEKLSGWNTAPLLVTYSWCSPPIEDDATLVAGIVGFKVHGYDNVENVQVLEGDQVPFIEANHVWAMMLSPDSKLRR